MYNHITWKENVMKKNCELLLTLSNFYNSRNYEKNKVNLE